MSWAGLIDWPRLKSTRAFDVIHLQRTELQGPEGLRPASYPDQLPATATEDQDTDNVVSTSMEGELSKDRVILPITRPLGLDLPGLSVDLFEDRHIPGQVDKWNQK
jgi:hypothetical protein